VPRWKKGCVPLHKILKHEGVYSKMASLKRSNFELSHLLSHTILIQKIFYEALDPNLAAIFVDSRYHEQDQIIPGLDVLKRKQKS